MIRNARPDLHIGLFLHIPFPAPQLLSVLPWREQIIDGMLGADLIGFQTTDDADRFRAVADRYGSGSVASEFAEGSVTRADARRTGIGTFPISIDFDQWDQLGAQSQDAAALRRATLGDATLLLGVDRLDYTKGISRRIEAFGELLDEGRLSPDDCVFIQVAVPSRTAVDAYENEQLHMQYVVDSVNERHQRSDGSDVVRIIHSSLGPDELAQWYRAADIMMVTPFADGMNLVAKEFVASRSDLGGTLILSEFAGSAHELDEGAFLVNPYDIDSIKHAVLAATTTTADEASHRMRLMRAVVRANDVDHWADRFLRRLEAVSQRRGNTATRPGLSAGRAIGTAHAIGGRTGSSW